MPYRNRLAAHRAAQSRNARRRRRMARAPQVARRVCVVLPRVRFARGRSTLCRPDALDVYEESLRLGRARVRIADERRERVREPVLRAVRMHVGRNTDVAPVYRDADLPRFRAAQIELTDAISD